MIPTATVTIETTTTTTTINTSQTRIQTTVAMKILPATIQILRTAITAIMTMATTVTILLPFGLVSSRPETLLAQALRYVRFDCVEVAWRWVSFLPGSLRAGSLLLTRARLSRARLFSQVCRGSRRGHAQTQRAATGCDCSARPGE